MDVCNYEWRLMAGISKIIGSYYASCFSYTSKKSIFYGNWVDCMRHCSLMYRDGIGFYDDLCFVSYLPDLFVINCPLIFMKK